MDGRPHAIETQPASMKLYSRFVKALRSLYTRSSHFLKQILAQVKNKDNEKEKGNPSSISGQSGTPITNKGGKARIKKPKLIPDRNVKQKAK